MSGLVPTAASWLGAVIVWSDIALRRLAGCGLMDWLDSLRFRLYGGEMGLTDRFGPIPCGKCYVTIVRRGNASGDTTSK